MEACKKAHVGRSTVFRLRDSSPAFAQAWKDALEDACSLMETEVRRRALEGWKEPVFFQGKEVGHVRKYSDTLAMFWLRAHLPHKYRENTQQQGPPPGAGPVYGEEIADNYGPPA